MTERLHRMWFAGAWVVLVGLGIFLTIVPQLKSIDHIEGQEAVFSAAAGRDNNGADELAQLVSQLDDIRANVQHKIKSIPTHANVAALIRDLTVQLDQHGIIEHEMTTGVADEIEAMFSIPVTINLTGNFLGIYASIDWLEAMPRLVRILRLKLENPGRSAREQLTASANVIHAELLINVYYNPTEHGEELSLTDAGGSSP